MTQHNIKILHTTSEMTLLYIHYEDLTVNWSIWYRCITINAV